MESCSRPGGTIKIALRQTFRGAWRSLPKVIASGHHINDKIDSSLNGRNVPEAGVKE